VTAKLSLLFLIRVTLYAGKNSTTLREITWNYFGRCASDNRTSRPVRSHRPPVRGLHSPCQITRRCRSS